MATDDGFINISGELKASKIRSVLGTANTIGDCCINSPMRTCASKKALDEQLSMPQDSGDGIIKFSEFYCASVVSGTIITASETSNYYQNADNGIISVFIEPDSVVTDSTGKKNFGYKGPSCSSFTVKSATASNAACVEAACKCSYFSLNSGSYRVCFQDALTSSHAIVSCCVSVGLGSGCCIYYNAQKIAGMCGRTFGDDKTPDNKPSGFTKVTPGYTQAQTTGGRGSSDIRLKENIEFTGLSNSGLKIYNFDYINKPGRYQGVMAQDLLEIDNYHPAVTTDKNGYYMVDYNNIDVEFKNVFL